MAHDPVVVIGMHRSGTSVVAAMLRSMGLFIGWRRPHHDEAAFFVGLNEWLLRQCGGSWDEPLAIRYLLRNEEVRALALDYLKIVLDSPQTVSYLGVRRYLARRGVLRLDFPWGWKDPRNTFTLPIWESIYPRLRIIHVLRHGVDVAQSLVTRHHEIIAALAGRLEKHRWRYRYRPKASGFTDTLRATTIRDGVALWEEYVAEARGHVERMGDRALEIRYEDFLANPVPVMAGMGAFCGLECPAEKLEALAKGLRRERAYAFRSAEELRAAAREAEQLLSRHGYSAN